MLYQLMVFGCVCYYWYFASVYVAVFIFCADLNDLSWMSVGWIMAETTMYYYLSIYLPTYLSIMPIHLNICIFVFLSIFHVIYRSYF